MHPNFTLSSQLNEKFIGKTISIRGRIYHKEQSVDYKSVYLFIRDDNGLLTCIFSIESFPIIFHVPVETFISVTGSLEVIKQPFITNYIIKSRSYDLLSPPSEDIESLKHVISTIRFLYIRKLEIKTLLIIKRFIRKYSITFLEDQGFQQVETPIITSFTQINRQALRVNTNSTNNISEREKFLIQKSGFYLEAFAHTFGKVYTLTPAFRADHRESELSLAEFWLLEVEEIFSNIDDQMHLVESLLQFVSNKLLENHTNELRNLLIFREISKLDDKNLKIHMLNDEFWSGIENLQQEQENFLKKITNKKQFPRVKYKEVLKEFEENGEFFQTTHLREKRGALLTAKYDGPVFITEFPFELRHFYDRKSTKDPTYTFTFDLLGHGNFGEIASGSEREYKAETIEEQMHEKKLRKDNNQTLQWYYKLQQFGSVPHAGFTLGIERLTTWLTQTENIADTIGFPRKVIGNDINY